jgi:hypothetical protein
MIIDAQNRFSDAQAVTASAISTNVLDLGALPTTRDLGVGKSVYLCIYVDTTTVSAGSTTCTFSLESDSTADLATSATVHWTSTAIAKATLVAGYVVAQVAIPLGSYERYLGVRYTVAVANFSAGAFTAFLTTDLQKWRSYADAIA